MSRRRTTGTRTMSRNQKKGLALLLVGRSRRRQRGRGRRNRKQNNWSLRGLLLLVITVGALFWFIHNDVDLSDFDIFDLFGESRQEVVFSEGFQEQAEYLSLLYDEGRDVYYMEIITIDANDWDGERLDIGGHDRLGRTLPITAFLSHRNVGSSESRNAQTHEPTGWDQNQLTIDGIAVWVKNRGHLIAYTLTFNFNERGELIYGYAGSEDDPWNLFTQTAHSNQNVMTRYEGQIRDVLRGGSEVVFMASPIFRDDELMARGIWLQAVSTCGELTISVYVFNRQPGVEFDYSTGENWLQ